MKKSSKAMITGAAMAGLLSGSFTVRTQAARVSNPGSDAGKSVLQMGNDKASCGSKDGCKTNACKGKHDCKGKNACKGAGGCKTGDNGCKGKNDCKGKGGCNTNNPS